MLDRSAQFSTLVSGAQRASGAQARAATRQNGRSPFVQPTSRLVEDIALLTEEVRQFRLEQAKASLSSVSRTGAIISATADRLKRRFDELEETTKIIAKSVAESRMPSAQEKQHWERVCSLLEQRVSALTKEFASTLEKRARSLADRSERQKSLFGEGVNYQYKYPPPQAVNRVLAPPEVSNGAAPSIPYAGPSTDPFSASSRAVAPPATTVRHRGPLLTFEEPSRDNEDNKGHTWGGQEQQQVVRKRDRLDVMRARLNDVQKVEKTIGELGQMFSRVAGMVKEQEEVVNDIEVSVDDTQAHTSQAQMELLKLFKFVSSDRSLIIKLLIATLLFGMFVIYFWT
jgi:hypothetical protein